MPNMKGVDYKNYDVYMEAFDQMVQEFSSELRAGVNHASAILRITRVCEGGYRLQGDDALFAFKEKYGYGKVLLALITAMEQQEQK